MQNSPNSFKNRLKTFLIIFICCCIYSFILKNSIKNENYYIYNTYTSESTKNETVLSTITKTNTEKTETKCDEMITTTTTTIEIKSDSVNIYNIVKKVANEYNLDPYIILSVIEHESNYDYKASNGEHYGLMQISEYWNRDRIKKLNVVDIMDPESNIRLGADILHEFISNYNSLELSLMLYNMDHDTAFEIHENGEVSYYASSVISRANEMREQRILE